MLRALALVVPLWLALPAMADEWTLIPLTPLPSIVPTDFGSLRMVPADAQPVAPGTIRLSMTTSYFNAFRTTWHTPVFHGGLGLKGTPLTDGEVSRIEHDFPNDDVYHLDVEGLRSDLVLSAGAGNGIVLTGRVPFIQIGAPNWDLIAEDSHRYLFGSKKGSRTLFPRGETMIYIRGHGTEIRRLNGLDGRHIGDSTLTVAVPMANFGRLTMAVKAPTGKSDSLFGSGAWDEGIGWNDDVVSSKRRFSFAASYSRVRGSFLGACLANMINLSAEAQQRVTAATTLRVSLHGDTSNLRGVTHTNIGQALLSFTGGVVHTLRQGRWFAVDLFENYPALGVANDWVIQIGFGGTLQWP